MELACTRAIAHLATRETNARRVIVSFFDNRLSVEALLFIKISMNVHLCLARTAERALMELTCTRVSACQATQEANAKQVRAL